MQDIPLPFTVRTMLTGMTGFAVLVRAFSLDLDGANLAAGSAVWIMAVFGGVIPVSVCIAIALDKDAAGSVVRTVAFMTAVCSAIVLAFF